MVFLVKQILSYFLTMSTFPFKADYIDWRKEPGKAKFKIDETCKYNSYLQDFIFGCIRTTTPNELREDLPGTR